MAQPHRLDFGTFMAPFHKAGENPTLALQRDLETIELMDRLGYDEAWIGEHHSAGWEIIASPEVFIAAAAERTRRIRLGTGVVSVPYHNPFHTADRMVLLDHLTRGRVMLGVGPGALPSDAHMFGIPSVKLRERMNEGLAIMIRLMTEDEPITYKSDWFELNDARLQLKPYQRPTMPMAVASTLSPSGMTSAGQNGVGVLSIASYAEKGLMALKEQWAICEGAADDAGKPAPDRRNWRIVMPFHLADSKEEAIRDVEDGLFQWNNGYFVETLGSPAHTPAESPRQAAERLIEFGGIIGTPDDAIAAISRLQEVSGGFGCLLGLDHEWTTRDKARYSLELMARYVMPHFQDTLTWLDRSATYARENQKELMGGATAAVLKAIGDHTQKQHQKNAPAPEIAPEGEPERAWGPGGVPSKKPE